MHEISRPFVTKSNPKDASWIISTATRIWKWRSRFVSEPNSDFDVPIRIVCISDTHNTQPLVAEGDVLIHAGDLSVYGTFAEIQKQLHWLARQPHGEKVVIPGNHDLLLDADFAARFPDRELDKAGVSIADLDWQKLTYLQNSSTAFPVEVAGKERTLNIFGSPLTMQHGNFAFQYPSDKDVWSDLLPPETDIVITHGPPKGHLDDTGLGCRFLLKEIWRVQPRLLVCGHIHGGRGREVLTFDATQYYYERVIKSAGNFVACIDMMVLLSYAGLEWIRWRFAGQKVSGRSVVINAAMTRGKGYDVAGDAIVEDI